VSNALENIHPDLRALAVPISELSEDPENANAHSERGREALVAAFTEFGQRKPIVVRREGMIVEAGNGTLAALRSAGWTHLACVVCDDDEQKARAFAIADNQTARLSAWDFDQLRASTAALLDGAFNMGALGFDEADLASIAAGADALTSTPTVSPTPSPPLSPDAPTSDVEQLGGEQCSKPPLRRGELRAVRRAR